ncbi:unnamed protein product, partial [Didymodactylos carnosus]
IQGNYGTTSQSKNDQSVTLTWSHISAQIQVTSGNICKRKTSTKQLLTDVCGIAAPGDMLAIMGSSGAGKTTLLNVLSGRKQRNMTVAGDIRFNGVSISSSLASQYAYVEQEELFIGTLTVKEHLIFQAMLKMDSSIQDAERQKRVQQVLNDLNLNKCQNTLIGVTGKIKGISGGERKRLMFAAEALTDPPLLFCDEPTSGLDSFLAKSIIDIMKQFSLQGKTIVTVIHQPSSEIFSSFDTLCLLAEGHLAYFGTRDNAIPFFSAMGRNLPPNYNPCDFYIEQLSNKLSLISSMSGAANDVEQSVIKIDPSIMQIIQAYKESNLNKLVHTSIEHIDQNSVSTSLSRINGSSASHKKYRAGFFRQTKWLLWRSFLSSFRNPMRTRAAVFQTVFTAIIMGVIYLRLKLNQEGIQNINSILFLLITSSSFNNMFAVINTFPPELNLFYREHKSGMYRVIVYYFTKFLTDVPYFIIMPFLFTTILYWMSGIKDDWRDYLLLCGVIIIVANVAASFGTLLSSLAPNTDTAIALSAPLLVPLMIFSGFYLNNASVPIYFKWLTYISWFNYANELNLIIQWRNVKNITCNTLGPCYHSGEDILAFYKVKEDKFYFDLSMLFALFVAFRLIAFIILWIKAKRA